MTKDEATKNVENEIDKFLNVLRQDGHPEGAIRAAVVRLAREYTGELGE